MQWLAIGLLLGIMAYILFRSALDTFQPTTEIKPMAKTFTKRVSDAQDRINTAVTNFDWENLEGFKEEIEGTIGELEELRDEQQEKLDNLPDSLRSGAPGEKFQNRYESLEEYIGELQSALDDLPEKVLCKLCKDPENDADDDHKTDSTGEFAHEFEPTEVDLSAFESAEYNGD